MEEVNFALIADQLLAILGPIVATLVSTLMGTEAFKWVTDKLKINISARTVTWIVWGVVALIVWLVLDLFPLWFVVVLGVLAAGGYSWWIKPVLTKMGIAKERDKVPPIGGGGGGVILKP